LASLPRHAAPRGTSREGSCPDRGLPDQAARSQRKGSCGRVDLPRRDCQPSLMSYAEAARSASARVHSPTPAAGTPLIEDVLGPAVRNLCSASALRQEEGNWRETGRLSRAGRTAQEPRFRRSGGVWQDQDSNLGRRKPAILQAANLAPRRSRPIPTWSRASAVTSTNGLPTAPAVTWRPRPYRPVPRGPAPGGGKVERNPAAVRPEFRTMWHASYGLESADRLDPGAYRSSPHRWRC
jgi:hypothetical protein